MSNPVQLNPDLLANHFSKLNIGTKTSTLDCSGKLESPLLKSLKAIKDLETLCSEIDNLLPKLLEPFIRKTLTLERIHQLKGCEKELKETAKAILASARSLGRSALKTCRYSRDLDGLNLETLRLPKRVRFLKAQDQLHMAQNAAKQLYKAYNQVHYLLERVSVLADFGCEAQIPSKTAAFLKALSKNLKIFDRRDIIGDGGFSKVSSVRLLGKPGDFALKETKIVKQTAFTLNRSSRQEDKVRVNKAEHLVLLALSHPNIVKVELMGLDPSDPLNPFPFLVMEKADTTLADYLKNHKLTQKQFIKILRDITSALEYLHNVHKITFNDVKPENILLFFKANGEVTAKLTDFGLANFGFEKTPFKGTLDYCSPEMVQNSELAPQTKSTKYLTPITGASDIWSLGILIYNLLRKPSPRLSEARFSLKTLIEIKNLLQHPDAEGLIYKICVSPLQSDSDPYLDQIDPKRVLRDTIIPGIFQKNPKNRLSASQILALLKQVLST